MLFRSHNGSIVIINKYEFKNDQLYYNKMKSIKFGKNDVLNSVRINSANYSNDLIDHLLKRSSNDLDNQE
uniref:Uncharacterized protein n=1 Tax=viral metagenome TaxID=1070528 RepID=A0A6C0BXQ4_9ZZZZ